MTKFNKFLVGIFLVVQLSEKIVSSQSILLITDYKHKVNQTEVDISTCNHIPLTISETIVAINTRGNCARFYASEDCTGNFIEVLPRLQTHKLGNWGFKNMTVSVGTCPDQCSANATGPVPPEDGLNVAIFDRKFYRGAMEIINVKGCHIIPRKFNYLVNSAITNVSAEGQCFQLYNNVDCQRHWTAGHDSVELRPGIQNHYDLRQWKLYPVRAISHCSFKCNNESSSKGVSQNEDQLTNGNQVMLYDEIGFKGNGILINKTEDCVNLDQYVGWEGATRSVQVFEDEPSCLVLYDVPNCSGNHTLALNSSKPELFAS